MLRLLSSSPSSPDPLNDSDTFQSPTRGTRRSYTPRQSSPLRKSSPMKRTFELDLGNPLSPQKLRVTVEPGSDTENAYSQYDDDGELNSPSRTYQPHKHRGPRITTTTVPLRGLSDSENEKPITTPKRGRPRKSGTPMPSKQHRQTLTSAQKKKRRRKSIGDQVYGDSENDADFQLGKGIGTNRGSARRRKSRPSGPFDDPVSTATNDTTKGRRKTSTPEEVVVLAGGNNASTVNDIDSGRHPDGALSDIEFNSAYSPLAYSPARSASTSDAGDEPDIALARFSPGNETPPNVGWSSPRIVDSPRVTGSSLVRQRSSYPSPSSLEKAHDNIAEEVDDGLDDVPEFDTILESEDFSMISVDSVPSLRKHLNTPLEPILEREASIPVDQQNSSTPYTVGADGSRANVAEAISKQNAKNPNLLSVQNTHMDDSFSSIPSQILEAATPARKLTMPTSSNEHLDAEDSFSGIASEVLDVATPGRNISKPTAPNTTSQQGGTYEDSFSAIPSVILDAATPAPLRQALFKPGKMSQAGITPGLGVTASTKSASAAPSRTQSLDDARLLTPDETPSPGNDDQNATSGSKPQSITSNGLIIGDESYISSQMKSSPPSVAPRLQTHTTNLRPQPQFQPEEIRTPTIIFSSPSLPPIQSAKDNPFLGSKVDLDEKPTLSPIVRTGRMLQDLIVPSSPKKLAENLGSPFKSPIAERKPSSVSSAINTTSQERREEATGWHDTDGNLFSRESQNNDFNTSVHVDDPFLNHVSSLSEEEEYSPETSKRLRVSDPRLSNVRSEGNSLQSEDDMSWQAEDVVTISQGTVSTTDLINSSARAGEPLHSDTAGVPGTTGMSTLEEKWAAERAAVSRDAESADASKVIVIGSEDVEHVMEDGNDDEDFGLLLETLNSSTPAPQPRHQGTSSNNFKKSRRSPSPMKMSSKRLAYSDELSHLSSPIPAGVSFPGSVGNDRDASSQNRTLNFKPRVRERRNQDVFALLAASPNKLPPVLSRGSQEDNLPPAVSRLSNSIDHKTKSMANGSEPQQYFKPIPQKSDFKPMVRDPESSFGSSPVRQSTYGIFGAQPGKEILSGVSTAHSISSPSRPLATSSTSKTRSTLPSQVDQPSSVPLSSSPAATPDSRPSQELDDEERVATDRTKEWAESVRLASAQMQPFASPTKSCLRSPLKTPMGHSGSRNSISPSKTVAFISSSPMPSSPAEKTPLSSTTWSRDHWLLVDDIVQRWKPENQAAEEIRRRNNTRVVSKLLGKYVRSGDRRMKLEQWHLEAVDEFRECIPGWQEETIAMRVFAIVVGERDRALGLVGKNA